MRVFVYWQVRIWYQAMPYIRVYEVCGPNDVTYEGMSSIINITAFQEAFKVALFDWRKRHNLSSL